MNTVKRSGSPEWHGHENHMRGRQKECVLHAFNGVRACVCVCRGGSRCEKPVAAR